MVSMDAKSPPTKDPTTKIADDENLVVDVPASSLTDDKQTSETNVTIVEEGEKSLPVEEQTEQVHCYCEGKGDGVTLPCEKCKKAFHLGRVFEYFALLKGRFSSGEMCPVQQNIVSISQSGGLLRIIFQNCFAYATCYYSLIIQ